MIISDLISVRYFEDIIWEDGFIAIGRGPNITKHLQDQVQEVVGFEKFIVAINFDASIDFGLIVKLVDDSIANLIKFMEENIFSLLLTELSLAWLIVKIKNNGIVPPLTPVMWTIRMRDFQVEAQDNIIANIKIITF